MQMSPEQLAAYEAEQRCRDATVRAEQERQRRRLADDATAAYIAKTQEAPILTTEEARQALKERQDGTATVRTAQLVIVTREQLDRPTETAAKLDPL